jgi:two-component system, OmpR family, response regulator
MRILLAEDDKTILTHIRQSLEKEGYAVSIASTGPDVWEAGEIGDFSAIILDLGLPGMDGLSILKRWRQAGVETPVLVISARGSWMERVDGFEAGADDYLPKPFRPEEFLARLKALLRRARPAGRAVRNVGRIALDENSRKLVFDGLSIDISPLEYRMIAYLIDNRDRVVAPIELALHVQGREDDAAKNAVEAMVARLRRKTAPDVIKNRRGFGYIIADEHE